MNLAVGNLFLCAIKPLEILSSGRFSFAIIHFDSIESTNIYALELLKKEKVQEGTIIHADFQERGKGQKGNLWESLACNNLTFSILMKPFLRVEEQFYLSKAVALGLKRALDRLSVENVEIKWPNDLLINGKKVGGILIENLISDKLITESVVGIGLNVNQTEFSSFKREATSLKLATGITYSVNELLLSVAEEVMLSYKMLSSKQDYIDSHYLKALHGYGTPLRFKDKEGEFTGVILGVHPSGRLQINRHGKLKNYDLKEIEFIV